MLLRSDRPIVHRAMHGAHSLRSTPSLASCYSREPIMRLCLSRAHRVIPCIPRGASAAVCHAQIRVYSFPLALLCPRYARTSHVPVPASVRNPLTSASELVHQFRGRHHQPMRPTMMAAATIASPPPPPPPLHWRRLRRACGCRARLG